METTMEESISESIHSITSDFSETIKQIKTGLSAQSIDHDIELTLKPLQSDKPSAEEQVLSELGRERTLRVLTKRLEESRKQISKLKAQLQDSEKEKELLKLQVLAFQKPVWAQRELDRERLSTRDLILKDKATYALKLYRIDVMDASECRNVLKEICVRLRIGNVDQLMTGLENVEKVMKLVPQMQQFIANVHGIVQKQSLRLENKPGLSLAGAVPHKFKETLSILQQWARSMENLRKLEIFTFKVHDLMGVTPHGSDSRREILETLREHSIAASEGHKANSQLLRIVNYFKELFLVEDSDDCFSKMNALYTFISNCEESANHLASMLELGDEIPPEDVLKRAIQVLTRFLLQDKPDASALTGGLVSKASTSPKRKQPENTFFEIELEHSPERVLDRSEIDQMSPPRSSSPQVDREDEFEELEQTLKMARTIREHVSNDSRSLSPQKKIPE